MLFALSLILLGGVAIGVSALLLQTLAVAYHLRQKAAAPRKSPPISILKPLCGVDDRLEENLSCFARLDYPTYEVVLGVKDTRDPAYPVAVAALKKWPGIFRLELQRGEPGFNPKVNQLITLEAVARHDILVVSDSNTQVDKDYLCGIAQAFEDETVACVTHPVVGVGEQTLGSRMDNLHLTSCVAAGQISAKRVAGKDLVIGKSMALRRSDLNAMGGFYAMKDYLAEDYVIGRWVSDKLNRKRVVVAQGRVLNISEKKTLKNFYARYERWAIIQRTAVTAVTNIGQTLMNPIPLTTLAFLLSPSTETLSILGVVVAVRLACDLTSARLLRQAPIVMEDVAAIFVKDFVLFHTWCRALLNNTVNWRGNELKVLPGSRLVPRDGDASGEFDKPEDTQTATGAA